ncbi:MAG: ATP synthase subunit I [Actinomycetota bacterium]|nr:ATP synthase subunit I [Actinomycetota bacterium]
MSQPNLLTTRLDGPAVEQQIAWDMIRRALPVAPVLMLVAGLIWGIDGALSSGYSILLVLANFALSAAILTVTARISLVVMMSAVLAGYLVRLALVSVAVLAVIHQSWVVVVPLAFTLMITHLGLLFWETRYVSATLAYPALRPRGVVPGRKVADPS